MTEPTELAIVVTSFEDLYVREYPGLVAVATVLSGDDSEDLVQDAMLRAFVNWDKVQHLERPGGWCHHVLVNLCRSRRRRRVTQARFLSRLRREEPSAPAPSDDVMSFWSMVRELPERPRLAVALFDAGDRTVVEVAGILGVPEGTVRSDLSRARSFMLSRMGHQS
ncbi:MAG: sigma-70 family RNA polymerase sigma factor [Ilumatobacteraceae bacterium]